MSKLNPFDFIKSINNKSEYMFDEPMHDDDYPAFFINRGLSYFADTVHYADFVNRSPNLTPKMQYDFLYHNVSKKNRFSKWAKKPEELEDLNNICRKYDCSLKKAIEYLSFYPEKELVALRKENIKGGLGNETGSKK